MGMSESECVCVLHYVCVCVYVLLYISFEVSGGKKQQGHLPVGHAVAMFQPLRIQAQPLLNGVTLEEQVMPSNGGEQGYFSV